MIRKLLLSFLLFTISLFSKIRFGKFSFKIALISILLGFSNNTINAQCNTASTGTVNSNTNKMCVGSSQTFSSDGWSGGVWSSSNPAVLEHVANNEFRAIGVGTANVIYSITQNGCAEVKRSQKTITVSNALGAIGEVAGASPQCAGATNQTYTIPSVANATNYVWSVPAGWSITSGAGTNSIMVTVGTSSQPGHVSVYASNDCATTVTKSIYSNVNPVLTSIPNTTGKGDSTCDYAMLKWTQVPNAIGYYLDIATDSQFTQFVAGYNSFNVGYNNGDSPAHNLPSGTLYYRVRAYNSCSVTGYSNYTAFTTLAATGGSVAPAQTICSGSTPANVTLTGHTGTIARWEKANDAAFTSPVQIASTNATLLGTEIGSLTVNTYVRAALSASYCTSYSTPVLITISGGGIVTPAQTICSGSTPADLTLNGYTGSVTRWEKSSTAAFTSPTRIEITSPTLSSANIGSITTNTYFRAVVNTGTCGIFNSSPILISIRPNSTIVLHSAAGTNAQTSCNNTAITNITYTTTEATGATFSGLPAGVTGAWASNRVTISGKPTENGTFSYTVNLVGGCGSANATGTITVNPALTPSVTITSDKDTTQKFCQGDEIWFYANPTNGGTAPTYQWYRGTTAIANQKDYRILFSNLKDGEKVSVKMTSNAPCATGGTVTSNEIQVAVYMTDRGRTKGGGFICLGDASPELRVDNAEGTNIDKLYEPATKIVYWEYSTDGNNTWTKIDGTAGKQTYQPPNLTVSTTFRAVAQTTTPVLCKVVEASIETKITVNIQVTIPSQSTAGQTRCDNTPFNSISVTAAGSPPYNKTELSYQWYKSATNSNSGGISLGTNNGAQTNTYTPQLETVGTTSYYYCVVTGYCGAVKSQPSGAFLVNSNTAISNQPIATQTRCVGTAFNSISVTATGASLTYQWYSNNTTSTSGGTSLGTSNGANTATYTPQSATAGTLYYYCVVSGTCGSLTSGISGAFIVNPLPTISTQPANLTLCENGTGSFSVATSATNPTYLWEYSADGSTNWITTNGVADVSGYNTSSLNLSNTPLSYGGNYVRVTITSGGCSTISNTARLTVNPIATLSLTSGTATQAVCAGTAITSIVYTWGGGATGVNVTGLPAGLILTPDTPNRTLTISGTPTANGTFSVSTTGQTTPCSAVSLGGTITVNPFPSVSPITGGSSSICAGGTTPAFANATSGGTWSINSGTGTATVDASGIVRGGTAGTVTVVYTYSNGTCPNTATIGLTIVANHPAPTAGTPTRPTCDDGAEVLLSGLPASGDLRQLQGTNSVIVPFTSSGGTFTVTGLTPGTYRFAVDNGCALNYSAPVVIEANTYNGPVLGWSYGTVSDDDYVDFASNYTISSNTTYCSVTVSNGAAVTVADGKTLTVTKGVHVDSGTLTFENTSSLLQTSTSNTLNTGVINYKRTTPAIRKADYVYWSTPVKNQTLKNLSPATRAGLYYTHEGSGWIAVPSGNTMLPGKGYIIRGPENFPVTGGTPYPATFIGTPNNGHITAGVNGGTFCLIGNPYPSSLDADKFIGDNRTILAGTLYFWTHATYAGTGTTSKYTQDDYVVYNLSGGSGTTPSNPASPAINLGQFIGAGQGFFADIKSSGAVFFDNSMREGGNSNGQFFKPGKEAKTSKLEKHRVWLNLTNQEGAFKQILVGYIEGATDSYEGLYDGRSFDANKYLDFYSVNETEKLTIQGRALPFTDTDTVPLGYKTTITGDFTIAIDQADGNLSTQKIYLEDKKTGTVHDLSQSNYTFSTEPGSFADRFVLRYTNKTLGTGDFENVENGILVSIKNKTIEVLSSKEIIKEVAVYDINGKLLYTKTKVSSNELQISNLQSSNQVLFVKVTLENDFTVSKKIIFN